MIVDVKDASFCVFHGEPLKVGLEIYQKEGVYATVLWTRRRRRFQSAQLAVKYGNIAKFSY
jgi:hypothetical protein